MAFKTLDQLRTDAGTGLNAKLGLLSDSDNNPFGDTNARNGFLQDAFRRLWPAMGRLARESLTTVANQVEYTLTAIIDVEAIEVANETTATLRDGRGVRSWRVIEEEDGDDTPTIRLVIPSFDAGRTLYVIGYAPYLVPANGAALCDLPHRLTHVVVAGAKVEAYQFAIGRFANFERFGNENRDNAVTLADLIEMHRRAQVEFNALLTQHARVMSGAKRAMHQVS